MFSLLAISVAVLASFGQAVDLFLNQPVNIKLDVMNPSVQITTRTATIAAKQVCAVVQYCPLSNIAPLTSSGGDVCTVSSFQPSFDFSFACVTRSKQTICNIKYNAEFQSLPGPMCGSTDGVWSLESSNIWATYPGAVNFVPGAANQVNMYISLTPLEEGNTCAKALQKDYCGAVTDVSYLSVNVKMNANAFEFSHLRELSQQLAKKAVINVDSFPIVAYSNAEGDLTQGDAVFLVPAALINSNFELWKKNLDGVYTAKDNSKATISLSSVNNQLPSKFADVKASNGLSGGAVAGIIIAVLAVVFILVGGAWYRRRKYGRIFGSSAVRL